MHKEAENCANIISQFLKYVSFHYSRQYGNIYFHLADDCFHLWHVYFHLAGDCFLVIIIFKSPYLPDRSCNLIVDILDVCDAILCLCS